MRQHNRCPDSINFAGAPPNLTHIPRLTQVEMQEGDPGCSEGIHDDILDDVFSWVNAPTSEESGHILWLTGPSMSGKSTIALTLARKMQRLGRLGSFICHNTSCPAFHPDLVMSHITSDLTMCDHNLGGFLHSQVIRETHFEDGLLEQAKSTEIIGPVLIVVDVLDGSDPILRSRSLQFAARLAELPKDFRLIFVSRKDEDIRCVLAGMPVLSVACKDITPNSIEVQDRNIRRFIDERLSEYPELIAMWPGKPWLVSIVEASNGCFLWAELAVRFIDGEGSGVDASERIERLSLCRDFPVYHTFAGLDPLDTLYEAILGYIHATRFRYIHPALFNEILGILFTLGEYPSADTLTRFHGGHEGLALIPAIAASIVFLLRTPPVINEPLRPIHHSVPRLLTVRTRNTHYAHVCLDIMQQCLRFNIADLTSSYRRNPRPQSTQIRMCINAPLAYACRHWATHLSKSDMSKSLMDKIHGFFETKFLFWLEVMSLLGQIDLAILQLRHFDTCVPVRFLLNIFERVLLTMVFTESRPFILGGRRRFPAHVRIAHPTERSSHLHISATGVDL